MNGNAVGVWAENGMACLAVAVTEASGRNVEYIGRVPNDAAFQALTAAQKKAALVAAAKAARDADPVVLAAAAPAVLPAISGAVTL